LREWEKSERRRKHNYKTTFNFMVAKETLPVIRLACKSPVNVIKLFTIAAPNGYQDPCRLLTKPKARPLSEFAALHCHL
jgi:hypothetical protein